MNDTTRSVFEARLALIENLKDREDVRRFGTVYLTRLDNKIARLEQRRRRNPFFLSPRPLIQGTREQGMNFTMTEWHRNNPNDWCAIDKDFNLIDRDDSLKVLATRIGGGHIFCKNWFRPLPKSTTPLSTKHENT